MRTRSCLRRRLGLLAFAPLVAAFGCRPPEGGVPRRIAALLQPPPGFIVQCQDSLRRAGLTRLVCDSRGPRAEWVVRLDARAEVLTLSRYQRVPVARVNTVLDSLREAGRARLDEGDKCQAGYGHTWYRNGWGTFVTGQGFESAADSVTVILSAERSPRPVPC